MNTTVLCIALSAALVSGTSQTSAWQTNYSQAREMGSAQKKPLVIVFGSSNFLVPSTTPEISKLLAESYICVFVDSSSPTGRKLADSFELNAGTGLVITDRDCKSQAFWHQGDMNGDLALRSLRKYAERGLVVSTTEVSDAVPSLRDAQSVTRGAPIYDRRGRLIGYSNNVQSSFYSQGGTAQPAGRTITSANC